MADDIRDCMVRLASSQSWLNLQCLYDDSAFDDADQELVKSIPGFGPFPKTWDDLDDEDFWASFACTQAERQAGFRQDNHKYHIPGE